MELGLKVLMRPLVLVLVLLPAYFLGRLILSRLPDGRVKRLLAREYEVVPLVAPSRRTQVIATCILAFIGAWLVTVWFLRRVLHLIG